MGCLFIYLSSHFSSYDQFSLRFIAASAHSHISKVNKAFDYDSEKSIQNVTRDKDVRPEDESGSGSDSNSESGLNYDKILEEIGQFGR